MPVSYFYANVCLSGEYEAINRSFRKIDQCILQHFDHTYKRGKEENQVNNI